MEWAVTGVFFTAAQNTQKRGFVPGRVLVRSDASDGGASREVGELSGSRPPLRRRVGNWNSEGSICELSRRELMCSSYIRMAIGRWTQNLPTREIRSPRRSTIIHLHDLVPQSTDHDLHLHFKAQRLVLPKC
ncbi:hypothetical protein MPTK1_4g06850 [Marchantia polymorpha subsp. ruderalis]|uniref:Uncharacterized protein n=2 Tax=Marchantia polymorpha TaxID=3197 RepID=A0AAF6B777_MARPO|nr:hypothetical protein MARPO_0125s0030 [Marchantia polymorpha]PTQ30396.1 hypothetical protein MARPO_0125s0030 [Marchantia polymorpha]BBN07861.1 hypothetical protein Mp_4g06850 [Marchantia polymorpha subsp. ruderalis]BBN07862.1 hypothetical protein Mp_4g06850 [Marchantia polymorpha subsp. ruderalis]|eukprot:PTQ30395.1 hypothetical protein MARPO_0125s0030 [Marchantia polymorpha]